MKYYGLHFVGDDKTPVQVRVNTSNQQIWCRSCPKGEWTAWRRLDVERKLDGTLDEEVAESTHAKNADVAGKLRYAVRLEMTGDAFGEASFDGSQNTSINLSIPALSGILNRLDALEKKSASWGSDKGGSDY
nr:MAG TPA: Dec protein, OB-Fold, Decoration, VIRAL PROTEIN [Caudoviricetes sp.]